MAMAPSGVWLLGLSAIGVAASVVPEGVAEVCAPVSSTAAVLVVSRLSDSAVVVEWQLMTWLGLVVSDELRAKIAAACSTVHVVGGKEGPDEALDWLRRGVCSLPGVSSSVLRSCSTSLAAT